MKITLAKYSDLKEIIEIEQKCFPSLEAASEKEFKERFETFGYNFLVAIKDEKVIGFINGATTILPALPDELYHDVSLHQEDGDYQTVFGLDVLPEYQHQGVASALMKEYIALAKERGKKGIILTCKDHLIGFYSQFGYQHMGVSASCHGGAKWNDMLLIF